MEHHCLGCCRGLAEEKSIVFGLLMEMDVLMAHEVRKPSEDDWGSFGEVSGRVQFGILFHEALPRTIAMSLSNWADCRPPNDRFGGDQDIFSEVRLQKKAWRTKCFLSDDAMLHVYPPQRAS